MRARLLYIASFIALSAAACTGQGGTGTGPFVDAARDGTPPGDTPASDTGAPGQDSGAPMDTGTAPDDTGAPPADTGVGPEDTGVAPADTGLPVTDTGAPPEDRPSPGTGYRRTTTTATMVSACGLPGASRILANADDAAAAVATPFAMTFFSLPIPAGTMLNVSSNGFLSPTTFDPGEATIVGTIPTPTPPNALIAAYWADLVMGADGVCAVTVGSAPERRFIVQWANGRFYSGDTAMPTAGAVNFEVIYNEVDASLDFIYETIMGQPEGAPTRAAVGVEDAAGMGFAVCPGGHLARPPAPNCTAVTSGTRFRLEPIR